MDNINYISTGNPIVDAVNKINIQGNCTPETWYRTIKNESGKTNMLAVILLGEIVYWYRPTEIRDESGNGIQYRKKFKDDLYLQKSYQQLAEKYNQTKNQVKAAIILLENLGVIKRHFRNCDTALGKAVNVMYIELFPHKLMELTFPKETTNNNSTEVCKNFDTPMQEEIDTNTYTTTVTTSNTTTTGSEQSTSVVADEERKIFSGLSLSDAEILKIIDESNHRLDICEKAVMMLKQQRNAIINKVGWLISAIRNQYSDNPYSPQRPTACKNSFFSFTQNDTDFEELSRRIFVN